MSQQAIYTFLSKENASSHCLDKTGIMREKWINRVSPVVLGRPNVRKVKKATMGTSLMAYRTA